MPFDQDTLLAAANAAPQLDPRSVYGIAQTTADPTDAVNVAHATAAYGETLKSIATLKILGADEQRMIWNTLSKTEQKMYSTAGYEVPKKKKRGFFDSAFHTVTSSLGHGIHTVTETPMHLVGEALHVAGAPLRFMQHAYRTANYVDDLLRPDEQTKFSLGSLEQWAKGWRETSHGEKSFLPSRDAEIKHKYGDEVHDLAKRIASGESIDDIILSAPENQREKLAQRLNDDAEVKAATQELEHAKMSFGRSLVSEHFWQSHPAVASAVSGGFDALFDVAADPFLWGGKVLKAAELVPYMVKGENAALRIGEILDRPGGQRMLKLASRALNRGGPDELMRKFPRFATVAKQMVEEGVDSPEKMREFFQGVAGQHAIMEGRVGGFAQRSILNRDPAAVVPHVGRMEAAMMPAKEALGKSINFAAKHHVPLAGSLVRITKLVAPRGAVFKAQSPEAMTYFQRIADYALPRARTAELMQQFAESKDPGQQFNIYKGLVSEVMDAMRVPKSYKDQFFNRLEGALEVHNYGLDDVVNLNGQEARVGFTVAHTHDAGWAIPDFRELRMQADRAYVMQKVYGTINSDTATGLMNRWKPAQLLRIGMPIRTGGEELVAAMLREGPVGIIRGRLAESSLKDSNLTPFPAIWRRTTAHLPEAIRDTIRTPGDYVGQILGDRAHRAFRAVEGKAANFLTRDDYVAAAKAIHMIHGDSLAEELSAVHSHGAGFLSDGVTMRRMTRQGTHARPLYLKPDGTYKGYAGTEDLYTQIWQKNLDDYSRDPLMKVALEFAGDGEARQVDEVIAKLKSDEMAEVRKWSVRNFQTSDGRLVGAGATEDEALRDWAAVVVKNANHVTSDAAGTRIPQLLNDVQLGNVTDLEFLNNIPAELRPVTMSGPRMIPVYGDGKWAEIQTRGFGYIGEMINWIAREPMYVHNMALAMREVEAFRPLYATNEFVDISQMKGMPWAHYTTPANAESIAKSGFHAVPGDVLGGPQFGEGVYIGKHGGPFMSQMATEYQTFREAAHGPMQVIGVQPKVSSVFDYDPYTKGGTFSIEAAFRNAGRDDLLPEFQRRVAAGATKTSAVGETVKAAGYDAMDMGEQMLVFDPANVTPMLKNNAEHIERQLAEAASQRALVKTLPFIHDPRVRSQFAEDARNLAPFMFAQEQFIKRFARTFTHSPEAFREAQLTMMGLRHAGLVKKDENGDDYFMYPGVNFVQNALSKAAELVTGHEVMLPLPVGFSGKVQFATPGTERLAAPSWGPMVAIPMRALTQRFPELTELESAVIGERGAGRPYWEQVTPTSMARLIHTIIDNPETSPQMHSAMLQALQYLEATGHGLAENASPIEKEKYMDRVKSWTRILFLTRTLYGFSVPAAPELQMDPNHLHEELSILMGQLPIEDAMAEFLRRHPDATPYTVFQSKNESGAPLPATAEAMKFMEEHTDFMHRYPQAAAWFLPQSDLGDFSFEAYREQMALGLRRRKGTDEFYSDMKFAGAADVYFATRDARDAALLKAKGDPRRTAAINAQWEAFKVPYLKMHPVFEERLLSPDGQLRRSHAITQIRDAVADVNLPHTAQNEAIATMSATYDALTAFIAGYQGRRDHAAVEARKVAKQKFIEWAHGYTLEHPEVQGLYNSVYRLEVGDNG